MTATLSLSQARRIALKAQGLADSRPTSPVTARQVGRCLDRIQLLQIDSVNVLSRSHYLPLFSRLGSYDRAIIDRLSGKAPRRVVEYWAHEASFVLPSLLPELRVWQRRTWMGASRMDSVLLEKLSVLVLDCLGTSKPLTARQVTDRIGYEQGQSGEEWGWNWGPVKRVLEHLFAEGVISAASRTTQFERQYTLMENVAVPSSASGGQPDPNTALRTLISAAAQAHGIGTVRCFADYFRTPIRKSAEAVTTLVEEGVLEPVEVRGWNRRVYRHGDAQLPRKAVGRALLSPFDSLVFERTRLEELFGFHYRLEIYTPAEQRRYGYYVLPFLLGEAIVARVDLKADRNRSVLVVRSAFAESHAPPETAADLAAELQLMARWLDLYDVVIEPGGDFMDALELELDNSSSGPDRN